MVVEIIIELKLISQLLITDSKACRMAHKSSKIQVTISFPRPQWNIGGDVHNSYFLRGEAHV